jgi:hypothetical protein
MLLRIVAILFPLFAITSVGFIVGRRLRPDLSQANKLNMDVFVPALIFGALANKSFQIMEYLPLLGATVVAVFGSGLLGWGVARALGVAPRTFVPPMMFNNCGNLGLPLAVLAFGDAALAPAVVMFMVSNLAHFTFGAWLQDHNIKLSGVWRIPTVIATLGGLAVSLAGVELWQPAMLAIRMLGDISIPLMLFALGVRISESRIGAIRLGVIGAVARPAIGLALSFVLVWLIPLPERERALLIVFGALPPAVLNYMFAERYSQEPEKVASMVLLGNVAAVLFLPVALAISL